MCFPGAEIVVGLMSSAVKFAADMADYEARAEQWRQNYTNALAAGRDEQRQISLRMLEEEEALGQQQQQTNIEGAEVAAEAELSANSAGIGGISLDNILVGVGRKVQTRRHAESTNYRYKVTQLNEELKATNTTIQNRINSVQKPVQPNPLGYFLSGIGGALGSA